MPRRNKAKTDRTSQGKIFNAFRIKCRSAVHLPIDHMNKISRASFRFPTRPVFIAFAQTLAAAGVELISTGGTAKALREAGLTVKDISDHTGFPEMMDGRERRCTRKSMAGCFTSAATRNTKPLPNSTTSRRLIWWWSTCIPSGHGRQTQCRLARRHREHRHRRPVHAPQRGEEPTTASP